MQRDREEKLARILKDFLHQYLRGDKKGFVQRAESEAERLSHAGVTRMPKQKSFFDYLCKYNLLY